MDEKTFAPTYQVLPEKKKALAELKKAAKEASEVYLAPDPDREGEAICWHLHEELKGETDATFHRVLFHEITKKAMIEAFDHPMEIDANKVDAQQARRILDRLVGYKISPLLWEKVRRGLSAGRVQSVALRIICERERLIQAFVTKEYWSLVAQLAADEPPAFTAKLAARNGKKIELVSREEVEAALANLGFKIREVKPVADGSAGAVTVEVEPAPGAAVGFKVVQVQSKEKRKNPPPPFTTSKLQQDAARQLGYPVGKTMRLAQGLYEGREIGEAGSVGLITYMRTDSTRVSEEAIAAVRSYIDATYGKAALPPSARDLQGGEAGAGGARGHSPDVPRIHTRLGEGVPRAGRAPPVHADLEPFRRLADGIGGLRHDPRRHRGGPVHLPRHRLGAQVGRMARRLPGRPRRGQDRRRRRRRTSRRTPRIAGFRRSTKDRSSTCGACSPRQHFTQPPPRFTEATLVKELEENGIGRPSTYATILSTIMDRDYVEKEKARFHPTELGFLVNELMVAVLRRHRGRGLHSPDGRGARRDRGRPPQLGGRAPRVPDEVRIRPGQGQGRDAQRQGRGVADRHQVCDKCGKPMVLKWGRFGRFLACSGYPECKNTREANGNGKPVAEKGAELAAVAKAAPGAKVEGRARSASRPRRRRARSAGAPWS